MASEDAYTPMPEEIDVNLLIHFELNSSALMETERAKLGNICRVINRSTIQKFLIVGHTDAVGDAAYNQRLSLLRAQEVQRHLVDWCGISPDRLDAIGVGESYPLEATDSSNEQNRRVEFQVRG